MRIDYTQSDLDAKFEELKKIRCKCGSKMTPHKTKSGLAVDLTCSNESCKTAYHTPLTDRDKLPAPGSGYKFTPATEYTPAKEYRCKECQTSIPENQALQTFEQYGKALCINCESPQNGPIETII